MYSINFLLNSFKEKIDLDISLERGKKYLVYLLTKSIFFIQLLILKNQ